MKTKNTKKQTPPPPPLYLSEGHWEDVMLENYSYYDIDILEKHNAPIRKKIEKLIIEQSKASSWLGKWYFQIQIDKQVKKLKHYASKS